MERKFKNHKISFLRRRERSLKSFLRRLKQVFIVISRRLFKSKFVKVSLLVLVIAGLIAIGFFFIFSSNFDITTVEVNGNSEVGKDAILDELSYLQGKNIFLIRSSQVRSNLKNISPFIKSVNVEKKLPNTVIVNIEEREEKYIWINLAGCFLLDSEGVVVEVISDFEDINLSSEDVDILRGYGNLQEIEEELKDEGGSSEESEEVSETSDLSEEEVEAAFEQRKLEVISRVEQYWEDNLENVNLQDHDVLLIYSYDGANYVTLDSIDSTTLQATNAWTPLKFIDGEITRLVWESSSRFVVCVDKYRKIVFSTRRDMYEEVRDLEILLDESKKHGEKFLLIDLSSEVIVYEVDE